MTDTADNLSSRANALIEMGRPEEAIPLLVRAIGLDPDDAHTRCRFVLALMRTGKQTEALEQAEAALAVDASGEWPHRLRAILLGQQGRHKEALMSALEAVRIEPELPSALYTLGSVYVNLKRYRDADEVGVRILEAAPDDSDSHELLAFIAVRQNKHRDTEKHARASLRLNPENMDAMRFLAIGLRGQRKRKEATEAWLEVVRRNPTNKSYRHELVETSSDGMGVRNLFIVAGIITGLVLLASFLDDTPTGSEPFTRAICVLILLVLPVVYLIWNRWFLQPLPGVVQAQLKRRQAVDVKVAGWTLLEVVLTWIMAVTAIGTLLGLVFNLISAFVDRSLLPAFLPFTAISGAIAFGFWKLMQRVAKHKKFLRSQVD
jgi:tetratricopeptide (TPR) repeat protein